MTRGRRLAIYLVQTTDFQYTELMNMAEELSLWQAFTEACRQNFAPQQNIYYLSDYRKKKAIQRSIRSSNAS